jgi:hypothetical protein
MLSTEAAGLAISLTKGLIKLGGRLDLLMAERTAVGGPLVIPIPPINKPALLWPKRVEKLRKHLAETKSLSPDPLREDRDALADLLDQNPVPDEADRFFTRLFPELAEPPLIDPDAEYFKALKTQLPTVDWSDRDTRLAAFHIASGRDDRQLGYPARTALLVADVIAEFGAENTALFIRDERFRGAVQSVLERFAKPDLEGFDTWSPLLRHALGSTLNGLLDAQEALANENPWLQAVLSALALAREKAANPDNYLIGLVRGKGYPLLISQGLLVAGGRLGGVGADQFQKLVADFLIEAAPLVEEDAKGFSDFFKDHWGDLIRAGLTSLEKHGPALLEGQSPLLRETLLALIGELAKTPDAAFLSSDVVFKLAETAIGAVAGKPELLKGNLKKEWFRDLVVSLAKTLSTQGIRETFTREGLESVVKTALGVLADHPELLGAKPGIQLDLVNAVLKAVSAVDSLDAKTIATAAVSSALGMLASHPELVDSTFGDMIAGFTEHLAKLVAAKSITGLQAADLISAVAEATLRNPALFSQAKLELGGAVVDAVLEGVKASQTNLLTGAGLVATVRGVLEALALRGRDLIENNAFKDVIAQLAGAIGAGLTRAEKELGRRLDLPRLPEVLSGIVAALARGELTVLDPENPKFKELFAQLAEAAIARAQLEGAMS